MEGALDAWNLNLAPVGSGTSISGREVEQVVEAAVDYRLHALCEEGSRHSLCWGIV